MRLCFIVEEEYQDSVMPKAVAADLLERGHEVSVLEPQATATCLSELTRYGPGAYAAYVLKTVSDGPGITLLEAAAAVGVATVNNARAVRLVRDKAVAAALARRHGIAFPVTYFVARAELLRKIPTQHYPLVVKPSNGSSNRDVFRVETPDELAELQLERPENRFFIAQPYVENVGVDVKLYNTGRDVFAVHRQSPLHEGHTKTRLLHLSSDLDELTRLVGRTFGLDIYGVDVVETPAGWVVLDVNDFPSFGMVPDAARLMANTIEDIARRAAAERKRSALRRMPVAVSSKPAAAAAARCTLVVMSGSLAGQRFEVESKLEIGRQSCDCTLDDGQVSGRHALVRVDEDEVVIEDLYSTNGTWVNGVRIGGPRVLHHGDLVGVGETALAVELALPAEAALDTGTRATHEAAPAQPRCKLLVTSGPLAGRRFAVKSELQIGRHSGDCALDDVRVSGRHALVRVDANDVVIEDLGSTNGTWVNGVRIGGPRVLHHGDLVGVGETALAVELILPAQAAADAGASLFSGSAANDACRAHPPAHATDSPAPGLSPAPAVDLEPSGAVAPIDVARLPARSRRSIVVVAVTVVVCVAAILTVLFTLAGGASKSSPPRHTAPSARGTQPLTRLHSGAAAVGHRRAGRPQRSRSASPSVP